MESLYLMLTYQVCVHEKLHMATLHRKYVKVMVVVVKRTEITMLTYQVWLCSKTGLQCCICQCAACWVSSGTAVMLPQCTTHPRVQHTAAFAPNSIPLYHLCWYFLPTCHSICLDDLWRDVVCNKALTINSSVSQRVGHFSFLCFFMLSWCYTQMVSYNLQGTRRFGSEESEPIDWIVPPKSQNKSGSMTQPGLSEMFAYHATTMANTISTSLVVFSRKV